MSEHMAYGDKSIKKQICNQCEEIFLKYTLCSVVYSQKRISESLDFEKFTLNTKLPLYQKAILIIIPFYSGKCKYKEASLQVSFPNAHAASVWAGDKE